MILILAYSFVIPFEFLLQIESILCDILKADKVEFLLNGP